MRYAIAAMTLLMVTRWTGGAGAEPTDGMALIRAGEREAWFYVDSKEVTVSEFRAFAKDYAPSTFKDSNMPATEISFPQALAYCKAQGKRLPSSTEWQLACRGVEGFPYGYGSSWDPGKARMGRRVWTDGPLSVGSFEPNAFGIYDMVGNVWEWADNGDADGDSRYIHGGSWVDGPRRTKCSVRLSVKPDQGAINYGFRCARSVTQADLDRMDAQEAAELEKVEAATRKVEEARLAAEADKRKKVEAKARTAQEADEAARRAREAEAAKKAEAFARKVTDMAPVALTAYTTIYVDRHEVTVAAFRAFDPAYRPDELSLEDRMPATGVTYEQAAAYCRSHGKRLPTVKEWAAACLGGKGHDFSYGSQYDPNRGRTGRPWFSGADTVGIGEPNGYGIVNMVGNVWEWVDGWYDNGKTLRSVYGGGWWNGPQKARCTGESWAPFGRGHADIGFRCVVDEEVKLEE